jgi:pimeloyl-ACP methyl ester carboxylesterase
VTEIEATAADTDEHEVAPRRRPRWARWLVRIGIGLLAVVLLAGFTFLAATRNPSVPDFYDPPADISATPGTVLRSEPFDVGMPTGSKAWRVLYASTDPDGRPIAVSGLVIAPEDPPDGPRPVLAWSHGTTGIARPCAPSLADRPLEGIPDMTGPLAQGWVITLTDYPGLGTPSPHPYLVGESEGRAVLDSVRAAHELDLGLELDDRYAIWGHSQGGHAALFAGQLAPTYLPDLALVGVAALAPATELQKNLDAIEGTDVGTVLTVLTIESWTAFYPDIPDGTLTDAAKPAAARLARNCINQPSRFRLLVGALALPNDAVAIDPTTDPTWSGYLADNTPEPDGISGPVFVGQGLSDEIISAPVTQDWVGERCADRAPTTWVTYPGLTHNGVVGPGGADAFAWTVDRFAAAPVPASTCPSA